MTPAPNRASSPHMSPPCTSRRTGGRAVAVLPAVSLAAGSWRVRDLNRVYPAPGLPFQARTPTWPAPPDLACDNVAGRYCPTVEQRRAARSHDQAAASSV
ncbi:hypothetical protein PSPO01_16077 [Paraphaeosphaeria sporulosa]